MLSVLAQWLGPIFAKELVETARRRRYYFNRLLFGAALLFAIWLVYVESSWDSYDHRPMSIQQMADLASNLFIAVAVTQYIAVWVFVPLLLCASIAGEREAHTLDLLLTTKLSDREIVWGKAASRLVVFGVLVASGIPVLCLTMLFGGVDLGALVRVQLSTMLAAVFAAANAIYFSSSSKTPLSAIVRSYFWMALVLMGLPMVTILVLESMRWGPSNRAANVLWVQSIFNPIMNFTMSLEPEAKAEIEGATFPGVYVATYLGPLTVSAVLAWRAVARLRRAPSGALLIARLGGAFLAAFRPAKRNDGIRAATARYRRAQHANPLVTRARLARAYDRERHMRRIQIFGWLFAWGLIVFLAICSPRDLFDDDVGMGFVGTAWCGVALLAALTSAGGLVGDRRRGFLDQMLVTPLEAHEIVDGTIRAVWHHVRIGVWLCASLTLFFALFTETMLFGGFASIVSAMLYLAVLIATGVAVSLPAQNFAAALIPTVLMPLLIGMGIIPFVAFDEASGPIVWVATLFVLPITLRWFHRTASVSATGSLLIAVHFALIGLAMSWTAGYGHNDELPILAMNPMVWIVLPLEQRFPRVGGFGSSGPDSLAMLVCYWIALAANLVFVRRWTIAQFDRLAGRTGRDTRRAPVTSRFLEDPA